MLQWGSDLCVVGKAIGYRKSPNSFVKEFFILPEHQSDLEQSHFVDGIYMAAFQIANFCLFNDSTSAGSTLGIKFQLFL